MSNEPIFIVGMPRSGTTLLAAMLSSHSNLDCGPETQLFPHLDRLDINELICPATWPQNAIKFVCSLRLEGQKVLELFKISVDEVEKYLIALPPSINAILESLAEIHARKAGKLRWIEKTPNHILYLEKIRTYYPTAFIIRILRDPRDSALSITKKLSWASPSIAANLLLWRDWDEKSLKFFENDNKSTTLLYEELIKSPQKQLELLCENIGENFEFSMLDYFANSGKNLISTKEWWKMQILKPLDSSRINVWKRDMSEEQVRFADCLCSEAIQRYGYETNVTLKKNVAFHPFSIGCVEKNEHFLLAYTINEAKIFPLMRVPNITDIITGSKAMELVFMQKPKMIEWELGGPVKTRLLNVFKICMILVGRYLRGLNNYYLNDSTNCHSQPRGKCEKICDLFLNFFAVGKPREYFTNKGSINSLPLPASKK